jgi:hypothetical protein
MARKGARERPIGLQGQDSRTRADYFVRAERAAPPFG